MQVRLLDSTEHGETRPLYEQVFSEDSRGFVDYYYTEKTKDNRIYAVEEDGKIRAMLHLNPYPLMVNKSRRESDYIVAVATEEAYRKRGYMGALLTRALRDMYGQGRCFTWLMPAAEAIYTPWDFRTVYEQQQKYCPLGETGVLQEADGEYQVSPAAEEETEELAMAAERYLSARYRVYACRDAAYYRRLKKECQSDGGKLMVYRRNGQLADCRPYFPAEDGQQHLIMARILDVRRMLLTLSLRTLTAVSFQVTDPVIEENNRCLVITGTEYSGVMLMDGKPENSEGTLTVAALTELVFGVKRPEELIGEPGVQMTERMQAELGKLLPLTPIRLNETV